MDAREPDLARERRRRFLIWITAVAVLVLVWLIFAIMLFLLEPFVLHRRFAARAQRDPEGTFRAAHRVHVILLLVSLLTIVGAVAGSHGFLMFE